MFKILDLYIIRKFFGSFFFITFLFLFIGMVIDMTERVDDFLKGDAPVRGIIFEYYLHFNPYLFALLSHLFIFISVIFFTSSMAYKSEIVAILSHGISFNRFLVPYIIVSGVLTGLLLYSNHFLIPVSNKVKFDFENRYVNKNTVNMDRDIHLQTDKDIFVYVETFNVKQNEGYKFTLEKIRRNKMYYKWSARKVRWNEEKQMWSIYNYELRKFGVLDDEITAGVQLDSAFNFKPGDFFKKMNQKESMSTTELNEFIARQKLAGDQKVVFFEIEKHRRTAEAFATVILSLIGVAVSSRKVRGGRGLNIMFGIAIACLYILMMKFSMTFATNASLPPLVAVWIPNIFFGIVAFVLLRMAPK